MLHFSKPEIRKWTIVLGTWLIFAFLISPNIIAYLFNDLRPQFVVDLLNKYPETTLDFVQGQWRLMATLCSIAILAIIIFLKLLRTESFREKIVGETTADNIGAIRFLVCFILLISTSWEDLASTSYIPREFSHPIGIMNLFHWLPIGFDQFIANYTALKIFDFLTCALLFMGMIGLYTRKVLPFAAICYMILAGLMRQYAWFYHTGLIPLLVLFVLCFTPSANAWSLDSMIRKWKNGNIADSVSKRTYGWARYAIWMIVAIPYFGAGISKIRNGGLFWWEATNFKHIIFYCDLRHMEFDYDWGLYLKNAPDFLFEGMALVALLGEILYITVLFSKWARLMVPLAMLLMHIGILFLQNILFFDLILLQVIFWNISVPRDYLAGMINRKFGKYTLNYQESSKFWTRAVPLIKGMDLLHRLEFVSTDDISKLQKGERKIVGAQNILVAIIKLLPVFWLIYPLVYLLAKMKTSYSWFKTLAQDMLNSNETSSEKWSLPKFQLTSHKLSSSIFVLLILCWVFRLELYPLTAMQMFSKVRGNIVQYEVVKAHKANGEVVRAPIKQSIWAMSSSRYRRIIRLAFDEKTKASCGNFLSAAAEQWNKKSGPDEQIIKMEVQRWSWDFINDVDNEEYGDQIAVTMYEMSPDIIMKENP